MRPGRPLLVLLAACAALLAACGGSSSPFDVVPEGGYPDTADAGMVAMDVQPDVACPTGQERCGTACVDILADPANCGMCTNRCPVGVGCLNGACSCRTPSIVCGGACIDPRTDVTNCGTCGHACATGETCMGGMCLPPCASPRQYCASGMTYSCVYTQTDPMFCGNCATRCGTGYDCLMGRCMCLNGTACGGTCADLMTDPANCGVCARNCGPGGTCAGGTCTCGSTTTMCFGGCVDTQSNNSHCGACGHACMPGQTCTAGTCVCAGGLIDCGGGCIDPMSTADHCGSCARSCGPGGACVSGACTCATGRTLCSGSCVDTNFDRANCGGCGMACTTSQACVGGHCVNDPSFRIATLGTTGCMTVDVNTLIGDDRGGIAVSSSQVFLDADGATFTAPGVTGRFALTDLSGGAVVPGPGHNNIISDLSAGTVYVLLDATGAEQTSTFPSTAFVATQLGVLNGTDGTLTTTRIPLSTPITMAQASGIFSGYARGIVFAAATTSTAMGTWYNIQLTSGMVTMIGMSTNPTHSSCENWAYWGVAEFFGGDYYAVYVQSSTAIVRYRIRDAMITNVGTFTSLSDMCSFTFSPSNNRWYFHYEGSGQFGGTSETLGYCPGTFETP